MPLCQKTDEIVPEIVFSSNWFRISLISQSVHLNLSLVNAIKKCIHFQCRKEVCFFLLPATLDCVGPLQLVVIGSGVHIFQLDCALLFLLVGDWLGIMRERIRDNQGHC